MKRNSKVLAAGIVALCALGPVGGVYAGPEAEKAPAKASERPFELMVGDKAPALEALEFVKGDTVTGFEKGKVYVLEFWATWCGPCIASMPHLSELQKQYANKGVTIIGVTSPDQRNTLPKVKEMVTEKGDGMGYTVAWDADKKVGNAFMKAAGRNGIPCSFVVDQNGYIAFIGHPMQLDEVLEGVVGGTWDMKKAAADYVADLQAQEDFRAFDKALRSDKNYALAYGLANKMLKGPTWDNADYLNGMAWMIVNPKGGVEKKDLDLALKAAARANELTGDKDAGTIDTLARVYFLKGDHAKAIALQTRAVALAEKAGNDKMTEALRETLKEFQGSGAN